MSTAILRTVVILPADRDPRVRSSSLTVRKRFDMGGLFEVIIIERRASQRAETLGNKPAQPSDYQMEISQRKPTLAGEDRAQADGPRKNPPKPLDN